MYNTKTLWISINWNELTIVTICRSASKVVITRHTAECDLCTVFSSKPWVYLNMVPDNTLIFATSWRNKLIKALGKK